MMLSERYLRMSARSISAVQGLVFSIVTKKIIVYSMARMTYSSIQPNTLPFVSTCLWIRYDENLAENGDAMLMWFLCAGYYIRLMI
mmetsp:Transcript_28400/g.83530  ORF Transcript_28400/g.83530 Transcript_28400/m.83530 type:complete len:86 (-) Transcript_28400:256-513(-)